MERLRGISEEDRSKLVSEFFAKSPVEDAALLIARTKWHLEKQEHQLALADSREAVRREPSSVAAWDTWNSAAIEYYRPRGWEGAEVEAELALELAPDRPERLMRIVPLLLAAGKVEQYDAVCERIMDKWQDWSATKLGFAAIMCTLAPNPAKVPERLTRLVNHAVQNGPDWSN